MITGNDLWLNLWPGPQLLAQQLLEGKCGAAVILNPKTGAVYVMASNPRFDPNLIEQERLREDPGDAARAGPSRRRS